MKKPKNKHTNWFHFISPKPLVVSLLLLSILLSFSFAVFKPNPSPPCINADEAAFGYNAYALLKQGYDEYGNTLPIRLKSFGDYKMPLYAYLSVPFIATFGLDEESVRALNILLALLFPIPVYFLTKEIFERDKVGAISALLISVSLWKGIVERHAHEAFLATFLITCAAYFLLRFFKSQKLLYGVLFLIPLFLSLFAYQSSRLFAVFFFVIAIFYAFYKKQRDKNTIVFFLLFVVTLGIAVIPDVIYKPTRVENLLLINNAGFELKVGELRGEGGHILFYNKYAMAAKEILSQHLAYYSPQFLAFDGDENKRFGYPGMSPMTLIEYVFIFIGGYFLFKNRIRWRYYLLGLVIISPFAAALSWADASITRTLFLVVPLTMLSAYGMFNLLLIAKQRQLLGIVIPVLLIAESIFLFYSWDFYLNHYPQRALVARSWQCGYKELADYVKINYDQYKKFYITQKNGEPYIYMLFYLQYPPEKYKNEASLSAPDEYGFGQVEKFDKFQFSFPSGAIREKDVVLVGYPDDFNNLPIDTKKIKKIIINKEEIFWIYET